MPEKTRATPQHKVTIPRGEWDDLNAAMVWDGTNFSAFALAAIRQRVRLIKEAMALEENRPPLHPACPKRPDPASDAGG